ncbi:pectate lyase [Autumnicola psychrophila]|uniref:Pectate lyase n=1 Tax=Autumnicola psychrophila TaxID=3075592 RepID=A0ABU3DQL2_9FLAO|nr:pectate lyase [Zunongwangia sp. F225]MDT0686006.1 pectate lyase [Zunongwangia sp. F225]
MKKRRIIGLFFALLPVLIFAQGEAKARKAMLHATKYMVENVSTNGGYVWYYTPDLSRRWGEMEAYNTMIWVQGPGTVSMGQTFINAYITTGNEYYYKAAEKAAAALIWGQSSAGGWNYMIDFGGDRSFKNWYSTIGKNAWRLEEFQHYYGNDTYDDDVTSSAARFLLKMYLTKLDPKYKPALDKAIDLVIKSQYSIGSWPQRFPLRYDFNKNGNPDYSSYSTFNDDVIWENVNFLIQYYITLGEEYFLDHIMRGMNFYIISQQRNGAWGQQYNMQMEPDGARTYEPKALLPGTTYSNALLLLKFYEYTGNRKFLNGVPDAIQWLEKVKLPKSQTDNGRYTHSTFVELDTDKPIYVHREGSNNIYGRYYVDYTDEDLLSHYRGKMTIRLENLKKEYNHISGLTPEEVTRNSPLKPMKYEGSTTPQSYFFEIWGSKSSIPEKEKVKEIINSLDIENRWLVKNAMISNPFIGDGENKELTKKFASTFVGDNRDTSPYRDESDKLYISSAEYIKNMTILIGYINSFSNEKGGMTANVE